MSHILTYIAVLAFVFGALTGNLPAVAAALPKGAADGVELMLKIGGTICVWQGIMEVMDKSGLSQRVAKLLSPVIFLIFGQLSKNRSFLSKCRITGKKLYKKAFFFTCFSFICCSI